MPVPDWIPRFQQLYSKNMLVALFTALFSPARARQVVIDGKPLGYAGVWRNFLAALFPLLLAAATVWGIYWYVVIHPLAEPDPVATAAAQHAPAGTVPPSVAAPAASGGVEPPAAGGGLAEPPVAVGGLAEPPGAEEDKPQELGASADTAVQPAEPQGLQEMGNAALRAGAPVAPSELGAPPEFFWWFWSIVALLAAVLVWYYAKMGAAQFELLKLLSSSVMPLGILTIIVLAVILFGITTATESAAIGAAGAFLLGFQAKTLDWERIKQSVFLTAKTTAMVCWLFVGSALFSAVFALLGGQQLVEHWVLSLNLSPVQFMILSQAIIFVLGWPLEWTEIIVIFVPIFLPLLKHFNIDPILWGTLVFVNLQAAFLSPPVAMSAFYLKGVAPPHVTLNQIFAGMMPYMLVVILCMVIMYVWPGMTLWLPNYLYGGG